MGCGRFGDGARTTDALDIEGGAEEVIERGDDGFDFHHGELGGGEAKASVCGGEDFAFDDSGIVAERDEFH